MNPTALSREAPTTARRLIATALAAALLSAQPAQALAQVRLPALGESAAEEMSAGAERRLGEQIMREIRRDPDYLDDPVLLEYVQGIWSRLVQAGRARGDIGAEIDQPFAWEAFLVRDRAVNAFALPGGYIGVYLGLISITASADELASVLAHELSHVTQRHIARANASAGRQGAIAMAAIILGMIAASRSGNTDVAQAAILSGQAAAIQGQLNFSRDMEREADRIGLGVLGSAGFAPAGMARMFEKLESAARLNDSGGFPYLRSHPLTVERIGEARARVALVAPGAGDAAEAALLHSLMQARARVLGSNAVLALRRGQELDAGAAALPAAERPAAYYASALASLLLRDWVRAESALLQARAAAAATAGAGARRILALLGLQLALARNDPPRAQAELAALEGDSSRPVLLARGQYALQAGSAEASKRSTEALQAWVAEHGLDASAWALLAQNAQSQGLKLRALRAEAESHAALGDLPGAIERLRAAQRQARSGAAPADFVEASIIDARLRELLAQQRQLMAEARGQREPQRQPE